MEEGLELTSQAEATHFWFRGFRRFLTPVLADAAAGRRDVRSIDCGCGVGQNLKLLAPYGSAVGFDVTFSALARARVLAPVARGHAEAAPFASGAFDVATSFDVLSFVEDDARAVREMARLLRPGGVAVITVAALEWLRGEHSESWNELRRYDPAMVRRLAEQAGLRVERVQFLFGSLLPLMAAVRGWQRVRRRMGGRLRPDADIAVPAAPINAALTGVLAIESALMPYVPAPAGSSLLLVARKPAN